MMTSNRRSINLQTRKEENPGTLERTRHNARGNLNSHEQPARRASHRDTTKGVGMSESRKELLSWPVSAVGTRLFAPSAINTRRWYR